MFHRQTTLSASSITPRSLFFLISFPRPYLLLPFSPTTTLFSFFKLCFPDSTPIYFLFDSVSGSVRDFPKCLQSLKIRVLAQIQREGI
ncbi:hypothetical protein RchiOBHm_Chr2g0145731 [Rosa chinensis]|uniref:Uncharacterized protein n=1 Tax=Rosa chinensis TaxID=74649 RepID=A0A2P6RYQ4_ROSCH|nr:hypothetical protein RchiOBHm_Chr2g0145731 [Rosa chinensis]